MYLRTKKSSPLGSYVPISNPTFPNAGGFPDMKAGACPGKCSGCSKKRKCGGGRGLHGLGDSGLVSVSDGGGITSDANPYDLPGLNVPVNTVASDSNIYSLPGLTSGPIYPGASTVGPYASVASAPSASTPALSLSFSPTPFSAPSSTILGLSMTEIILGGLGIVAVMVLSGKRR